jgi:hypothetical protein
LEDALTRNYPHPITLNQLIKHSRPSWEGPALWVYKNIIMRTLDATPPVALTWNGFRDRMCEYNRTGATDDEAYYNMLNEPSYRMYNRDDPQDSIVGFIHRLELLMDRVGWTDENQIYQLQNRIPLDIKIEARKYRPTNFQQWREAVIRVVNDENEQKAARASTFPATVLPPPPIDSPKRKRQVTFEQHEGDSEDDDNLKKKFFQLANQIFGKQGSSSHRRSPSPHTTVLNSIQDDLRRMKKDMDEGNRPERIRSPAPTPRPSNRRFTCWWCKKEGHAKRECKALERWKKEQEAATDRDRNAKRDRSGGEAQGASSPKNG